MTAREEDAKIYALQNLLSEEFGKVWTPAGLVVAPVTKKQTLKITFKNDPRLAEEERSRRDQEPAVTAMAKKQALRSIVHRMEKATQKEEMRNRRGSLKAARMVQNAEKVMVPIG